MKKRIFALFLSALLLTTVLCACGDEKSEEAGGIGSNGTSSSGEPVTGGELVVGISQDLGDSLDPYQMTAAGTREVLFNVYEGLVKPNVSGEYVPAVASDSTVSEDGLTYTFPLREGVLFHNGEAVTAEDVIYSFETCAETTVDTALAAALSSVEDISAEGSTVTITLSEANPDFLSYVGMVYIVPAAYDQQDTAPVGTGPFQFVSRSVQENLVLEKFGDYWGEKAYLDQVTFKIYEDANALMSALSAESVDMAFHLTIDQVNTVSGGAYKTLEGTMNLVQALYLNNDVEPFDNEKVRQAMCYAVNVEEILNLTGEGHGKKLGSSIYPAFTKYFDESLSDYYTYDVEKAKEWLDQSGVDPASINFSIICSDDTKKRAAEVIQANLKEIGINCEIESMDLATYLSATAEGDFTASIGGYSSSDLLSYVVGVYHSSSINASNKTRLNDPEVDALIDQAKVTIDETQQVAIMEQLSAKLNEICSQAPLYQPLTMRAFNAGLQGVEVNDSGYLYFENVSWAE